MFKKISLLFILSIILFSCSSDEPARSPKLWFKVNEILDDVKDKYSLSDLNVKIYKSHDDFLNEKNAIHSSKLDPTGEMEITKGIEKNITYFIDIFSDDSYLSNWSDCVNTVENIQTNCAIRHKSNENSEIPIEISLNNKARQILGVWNFSKFRILGTNEESNRKTLKVNRDLTVESIESINDVEYKLIYRVKGFTRGYQCGIEFISVTPSTGYNISKAMLSDHIYINVANKDEITFWFGDTEVIYKK